MKNKHICIVYMYSIYDMYQFHVAYIAVYSICTDIMLSIQQYIVYVQHGMYKQHIVCTQYTSIIQYCIRNVYVVYVVYTYCIVYAIYHVVFGCIVNVQRILYCTSSICFRLSRICQPYISLVYMSIYRIINTLINTMYIIITLIHIYDALFFVHFNRLIVYQLILKLLIQIFLPCIRKHIHTTVLVICVSLLSSVHCNHYTTFVQRFVQHMRYYHSKSAICIV